MKLEYIPAVVVLAMIAVVINELAYLGDSSLAIVIIVMAVSIGALAIFVSSNK